MKTEHSIYEIEELIEDLDCSYPVIIKVREIFYLLNKKIEELKSNHEHLSDTVYNVNPMDE